MFVPAPKNKPARSPKYLKFVSSKPCLACGGRPPSDPHHIRFLGGGGTGTKPSDFYAVPLCRSCHSAEHSRPSIKAALGRNLFKWMLDNIVDFFSIKQTGGI
jgi:hypothetical protein